MAESTSYSCPQCKATLHFDPSSGKLVCDYCGGQYEVSQIEERLDKVSASRKKAKAQAGEAEAGSGSVAGAAAGASAEGAGAAVAAGAAAAEAAAETSEPKYKKYQKAGRAKAKRERKGIVDIESTHKPPEGLKPFPLDQWDEKLAAGDHEQFDEMVGYVCTNCGAQVVADTLTVATSCQYCGSSVVVDQRLTGGLKPGYVIPFKVDAKELPQKLTDFYSNRPLLPKKFFYNNQVGEVQGIYVPFWLYNGKIEGDAVFESVESNSWTEGSYDVTEIITYEHDRQGEVAFSCVPVDASERIDDDLMDAIEPYDYRDIKSFMAGYLTGFVAERFDQGPREVFDRAEKRMENSANSLFEDSCDTYARFKYGSYKLKDGAASYVLMPVYLFNCRYAGKMYRYAVNGQTGKIVGEVPTGRMQCLKAFALAGLKPALITAVITGIIAVVAYL